MARGWHVPGVERALRARPLARRDGRRGPRPRLVRDAAPHPRRDAAVGPHRGRPAPDFLWHDWQAALPSTGSPIAGGRRATTAGCAPTTRSSTWWPRRSRPRAAARAPARTSAPRRRRRRVRVPGPRPAGACGSGARRQRRSRCGSCTRSGGRCAGSRHRDVARAMERAFRITQLPLAFTRGVLAPPEGQLRARPFHRPRERRRVPRPRVLARGRLRRPRRAVFSEALPEGMAVVAAARSSSGRPRCKKR